MKTWIAIASLLVLVNANKYGGFFVDNYEKDKDIQECHGVTCPPGTVGCSKTTKTSTDTRTVMTTIRCEDVQGNVLNSATKTSPNKYEGTHISSFSFTGEYHLNGGQHVNTRPSFSHTNNFNKDYHNYAVDNVETFD